MKKLTLFSLCACLLALLSPTDALAGGKKNKANKGQRKELRQILAKYDKNGNGQIDGEERDALRAAFTTDTSLRVLDKNSDGTLDDSEINALNAAAKKGAKKKNKKNE